jgi:histone-lysine N-methyltransferase SETD2
MSLVFISKLFYYRLPLHWRSARDADGRIYYYHKKTRESRWEPPKLEEDPPALTMDAEEDIAVVSCF